MVGPNGTNEYFGMSSPGHGMAGIWALQQPTQNAANLSKLWGPYPGAQGNNAAYQGGGFTFGGGGLAMGTKRGNEMFAPLSPLAMSLRNIENDPTGKGMQDYKLAFMQQGVNPYAHQAQENNSLGFAANPGQQDKMLERGRQAFDITKNFVSGYSGQGVANPYQDLLKQRSAAGVQNPADAFGGFHSYLKQFLGG